MKRLLTLLGLLGQLAACKGAAVTHDVLACVGPAAIRVADLRQQQHILQPGGRSHAATGASNSLLLANMIDQRLLLTAAQDAHTNVRQGQVEAAFASLQAGWPKAAFDATLSELGMTTLQVKHLLRDRLLMRQYVHDDIAARVSVNDSEVSAYLAAHPAWQQAPAQVHLCHIQVKSAEDAASAVHKLRHGMPFAEAAQLHSLAPEAPRGGDLGWQVLEPMPAWLVQAVRALPLRTLSPVVQSPYGFHLFYVLERRQAQVRPASELQSLAEAQLRRQKQQEALAQALQTMRAQAPVRVLEDRLAQIP